MSWDEFYENAARFANQAAKKIGHTADLATLQVKLGIAEEKLDEAFTALGKVSYLHFTSQKNRSDAVAKAIANVEAAKKEVLSWRVQIERAKAAEHTPKSTSSEGGASHKADQA